jgi:hypothetical protein
LIFIEQIAVDRFLVPTPLDSAVSLAVFLKFSKRRSAERSHTPNQFNDIIGTDHTQLWLD